MAKYNKLLKNVAELIEKGLFNSKDLKEDVEKSLRLKMEIIANIIHDVISNIDNDSIIDKNRIKVLDLCKNFPLYKELLYEMS